MTNAPQRFSREPDVWVDPADVIPGYVPEECDMEMVMWPSVIENYELDQVD